MRDRRRAYAHESSMQNKRREACRSARLNSQEKLDHKKARKNRCALHCGMKKLADGPVPGCPSASLALPRTAFNSNRNHGLIVERFLSRRMLGHCFEDQFDNLVGGSIGICGNDLPNPLAAKKFFSPVAGIQNAVAEEYEHVSRFGPESE